MAAELGNSKAKIRQIMVKAHTRPLTMVKYNREGDLLFTTGKDHTPSLFYADNGERIGTYDGHNGTVWCVDVNFDSTKLLTGSADNFCKLWEVKTGECLHTWKHTAPVRSVGFALGDKKFLTVLDNIMGNTATIFVWDLELDNLANHPDCPLLSIQGHQAKINRALWGPLNEQLYSCSDDATLRLWDAKTGKQTMCIDDVHGKRISDMQFSFDMTLLVTSCLDNWVRLWDAKTLNLLKCYDAERPLNSACISPLANCPYLLVGGGQDAMSVTTTSSKQGKFEAVIFDHVYDEELGNITGHFGPINTLAFAPHGRSYASGGEDGYVRITHFPEVYFDAFSKKTAEAFDRPWPEKK